MARAEDDSWDIFESVGVTALALAEWRARESRREPPLISDPYAHFFVDEATARGSSSLIYANLFPWMQENTPRLLHQVLAQGVYTASRTKWFDDFFVASSADITQVVILAAGLDTRACRLPWKSGSAVYEIDQPAVLAFKDQTLRSHGVEPSCRHVAVGFDLRQDWPKALCEAGFDPAQPTAWSAEGLMAYLSSAGQDLLFERIHGLSAVGSRIAVDALRPAFFESESVAGLKAFYDQIRHAAMQNGQTMPEYTGLWYDEERTEVVDWLRDHGWQADAVDIRELMENYGHGVAEEDAVGIPECELVSGRLT